MNATYSPKINLWNGLLFFVLALPLGIIALSIISMIIIASLVLILTPIGMLLAPTWSVQLFQWKFETAFDAWYLPLLGILLDLGLVFLIKRMLRLSTQWVHSHN